MQAKTLIRARATKCVHGRHGFAGTQCMNLYVALVPAPTHDNTNKALSLPWVETKSSTRSRSFIPLATGSVVLLVVKARATRVEARPNKERKKSENGSNSSGEML